jgi:ABC-type nitrate/sulfonate/bicarbonate transport system substrate-binding protein
MTQINIGLEWFLNPDHLPMIAGIVKGEYFEQGLDVKLIAPDEHYDGFEQLKKGGIDIHCNEPLHLFEHYFDGLKSLGCFFETRGGVMIRKERIHKLKTNQKIRITTPASNPITNKIGFEILRRYALLEGFVVDRKNVEFVQNSFWHISNMKEDNSLDGAWLCFYNFEGIEAEHEGFENIFIDQFLSPYPNFSALEFMTTDAIQKDKGDAIQRFISVTNKMATTCKNNSDEAKKIYYEYTKETPSILMDKIIDDTLPRFETTIKADGTRWRKLATFLGELDIVNLSDDEYKSIWR